MEAMLTKVASGNKLKRKIMQIHEVRVVFTTKESITYFQKCNRSKISKNRTQGRVLWWQTRLTPSNHPRQTRKIWFHIQTRNSRRKINSQLLIRHSNPPIKNLWHKVVFRLIRKLSF